jgi:hypothetical protein
VFRADRGRREPPVTAQKHSAEPLPALP